MYHDFTVDVIYYKILESCGRWKVERRVRRKMSGEE
jgi:hypothetical protein